MTNDSRLSLIAAGLALFACLVAASATLLPARGHPPLSDYVGAVAVPIAWILALLGIGSAFVDRESGDRGRYRLALAGNVAALVAGFAIWFLWPLLRSA